MTDKRPARRASFTTHTKRMLWAESGGYCMNPDCLRYLFDKDDQTDFAELAHIIPAVSSGPRAEFDRSMTRENRSDSSNIVLLCANCHTLIDKASSTYPPALLHRWKSEHRAKMEQAFAIEKYTDRESARRAIEPLLRSNELLFNCYGPSDTSTETTAMRWHVSAVQKIIPDNSKISKILLKNEHLLRSDEIETFHKFELHREQFEARHLWDDWRPGTLRYPHSMNEILQ